MDFVKRIGYYKVLSFLAGAVILPLFVLAISSNLLGKRQTLVKKAAEGTNFTLPSSQLESAEENNFKIYPLDFNQPVYRLSIDGKVVLKSENSLVRVVLIDKEKNEYLVYEAYPLVEERNSFSVTDVCEETCALEGIVPDFLRIEGGEAEFEVEAIKGNKEQLFGATADKEKIKKEKDDLKIRKMNEEIKKKGLRWVAGETSVSKMTYAEKKRLFFDLKTRQPVKILPNLQGFEYYKGGVFEYNSSGNQVLQASATDCQGNGKGLWLTGDNSYVSVGEKGKPLMADDFTIEVWTKLLFPSFMQTIISRFSPSLGRQYRLSEIFFSGKEKAGLRFEVGKTATNSGDLISEGEWTHLAVTRSKSENKSIIRGYISGVLVLQKEDLFEGEDLNNCLVNIGAGNIPTDNDYFIGLIDDLRVSNVVRNVADNWQKGVYLQPLSVDPNTLALWRFEDSLADSGTANLSGSPVGNITYDCGKVPVIGPTGTPTAVPTGFYPSPHVTSTPIVKPSPTIGPTSTPPIIPTRTPSLTPTATPTPSPTPTPLNLPSSWDWRNVHGENWNTPVRDQGTCGSCWVFGPVAAIEANINLYANKHLNLDLSEQDGLSCSGGGSCQGGWPSDLLEYIKNTGVVSESCFAYKATDLQCQKCSNWQTGLVRISDYKVYPFPGRNELKLKLIKKGVLGAVVNFLFGSHEMALVGWKMDSGPPAGFAWIFKNSWGTGWGENGYLALSCIDNIMGEIQEILPPITINGAVAPIYCVDKDKDSYCNWGISETKPSTCLSSCKAEKDCNDNDITLGKFDGNWKCLPSGISPTPTRKPTPTPTKTLVPTKIPTKTPTPTPKPARIQGRLYYDIYSTFYRASDMEYFGPVGFRIDYYDPYTKRFITGGASQACTDKCSPVCKSIYGNGSYSTPWVKAGKGYMLRLVLSNSNWQVSETYLSNGTACLRNRVDGVTATGLGTYLVNVYALDLSPGEIKNIWFGVKPKR